MQPREHNIDLIEHHLNDVKFLGFSAVMRPNLQVIILTDSFVLIEKYTHAVECICTEECMELMHSYETHHNELVLFYLITNLYCFPTVCACTPGLSKKSIQFPLRIINTIR